MAIIISRYNQGEPIREDEMRKISITDNPKVDRTLNQVLMRMNHDSELLNEMDANVSGKKIEDR